MKLDLQDLPCPQPVTRVKEEFDKLRVGESLKITINSETSKQNIERFLNFQNQPFTSGKQGEQYFISLIKSEDAKVKACVADDEVLLLKSLKIGEGELGGMLLVGFLETLKSRKITKIILINEAVKLACDDTTPAFEHLKDLEQMGVRVLACANCLGYFQIEPKVGIISNAYEILDTLFSSRVVSL